MYTACATTWLINQYKRYLNMVENEEYSVDFAIETIYQARNFSKMLSVKLRDIGGYTDDLDDAKKKVKFITKKIDECFASSEDKSLRPDDRKIKEWFTMEGDEKSKSFFKHDEKDRDNIFIICFALNMDHEQAKDFFEKVFYDSFFINRAKDVVFHYCLKENLPFSKALQYLKIVSESKKSVSEEHKDTIFIKTAINNRQMTEEKMLETALDLMNGDEQKSKQTVSEAIIRLRNEISEKLPKEDGKRGGGEHIYNEIIPEVGKASLTEYKKLSKEKLFSDKFDSVMAYNKAYLYNALPKKDDLKDSTLLNGQLSFFKMRNLYILLSFFNFWYGYKTGKNTSLNTQRTSETFIEEVSMHLKLLGFGALYPCNPYDLMFLLAVETVKIDGVNPIDSFQDITLELLPESYDEYRCKNKY